MVSTYTTNLRLTKQGDGDNPNSWGQVLNDQVIDLVDNAIAGWVKISVGTVSTVVLTEYSGAEDQSRKQIIEITGSVGDTFDTINVQIPATPKSYIVRTSMSYHDGAASNRVILKNAAGTGVSLTGGAGDATTAWFVTDGTTVVPVAQTNFGNINVGNVSVSGEFTSDVEFAKSVSVSGNIGTAGNVSVGGTVTITGTAVQAANAGVCASAFYGSGANLTGITAVATGVVLPWAGTSTSAPSGYLTCYGQAVSRSTYADLFGVLSSVYGDGDGSSTFNLPDLRGRVIAGKDDMGGTSADRLTNAVAGQDSEGVNGDNLGAAGGLETNTLNVSTLPSHDHGYSQYSSGASGSSGGGASTGGNQAATTDAKGGGLGHNNVQPTLILNYIIKT